MNERSMSETVGKISSDLNKNATDNTHSAHEQMLEQLSEYDSNLFNCVATHVQKYANDFFIVVITKKERLLDNVIRNYFFARESCPSPEYDQTLYKYDRKDNEIRFVWTIPSKDTCEYMKVNFLEVPTEERELLQFVLDFYDGTLLKIAKKLNGEMDDSPLLEGTKLEKDLKGSTWITIN